MIRRLAFVAVALLAISCDRTPRFVPAGADSTLAPPSADSIATWAQQAREGWESGDHLDETAALTARLVFDDLRLHPTDPLPRRVRTFLDSIGMGAEVAGRGSFAVANLFSRSDPSGGSWPYLFWRDENQTHAQAMEGGGMRLVDLLPGEAPGSDRSSDRNQGTLLLAGLFARVSGGKQQPLVFVWRRAPGSAEWQLAQSLGADSLGGVGTATFTYPPPADGSVLVARTHLAVQGFDECETCPHVVRTRRFRWGTSGLESVGEQVENSPYYVFVRFIQALKLGDRETASRWVADPSLVEAAMGYDWGRGKGLWRLSPGSGSKSESLVFFRGPQEAYRVHFVARDDDWLISGFEPTSRSIE
jgi:hypothetical protein